MSRHIQVTFDAHDPRALSSFWRDVLGYVHPGRDEVEDVSSDDVDGILVDDRKERLQVMGDRSQRVR
ncbi:MAG TPA: VOC family protein, partial [Nocardioides sp.]